MFKETVFKRLCFFSTASVFLLFILGGLVRSTGSGMGCPDWPKCFGKLVPPADSSSLPENYREQFLEKRLKKAGRTVDFLNRIGWTDLANKVKNDPMLRVAHPYNRATAMTEYVNRLFGVLTGIFCLLSLISAFGLRKTNSRYLRFALIGNFWVIFNGWLGSIVVETNLLPGVVTLHYAAAYLAMFAFIMAPVPSLDSAVSNGLKRHHIFSFLLLIVVLFLGTSSREIIDQLIQYDHFVLKQATVWVPGRVFDMHRLGGLLLMAWHIYLFYLIRKQQVRGSVYYMQNLILLLMLLQVVSGFVNVFYNIPALVNVVHIGASAAIAGLQFRFLISRREP